MSRRAFALKLVFCGFAYLFTREPAQADAPVFVAVPLEDESGHALDAF